MIDGLTIGWHIVAVALACLVFLGVARLLSALVIWLVTRGDQDDDA